MLYQQVINNIVNAELEKIASAADVKGMDAGELQKIASGLEKIGNVDNADIAKIADAIKGVVKLAHEAIDVINAENNKLKQSLELHEKTAKVREIVEELAKTGSLTEESIEDKVTELMSKSAEDLDVYKKAADLIGSKEVGSSLGTLEGDDSGKGKISPLEEAVLS